MNVIAIIVIFIGALALLGVYLWIRQRENLTNEDGISFLQNLNTSSSMPNNALIVASEHGQIIHVNELARQWLNVQGGVPNLEYLASLAQPPDTFLNLFASEATVSLEINKHWLEASSHRIPDAAGMMRVMVVLRELAIQPTSSQDRVNVSSAMRIISAIGETIDASMGVEPTLQVLLEIIRSQISFDAAEIALLDPNTDLLMQRSWMGDMRYILTLSEMGGGYRKGQGIAGWVSLYHQSLHITGDNDPVNTASLMATNPYKSAIAIPLGVDDDFIGALTLFSDSPNAFEETHLNVLTTSANAITVAIRNADLYAMQEDRIRDLANLQEITEQQGADNDTTAVYSLLGDRVAKLLKADMCGVFLYDAEHQILMPQLPFYGLPDNVSQALVIPVEHNTTTGDIWRNQAYWASNDVLDEPLVESLGLHDIIQVAGVRNTALFPMQIGGERIGMIAVSNKQDATGFNPNDFQSMRVLSTQAAIVVENLRLYQRERLIESELVGLQEMTHAIGALRHQGEFFGEITERIARLTGSTMCGILLYDDQERVLRSRLPFHGIADDLVADYVIKLPSGSVMEQLWEEEDYWYTNRVASDSLVYEAQLDNFVERTGVKKTLLAAMNAGGRRIGLVQISNKIDESDYDDKDARLLQIFATQAASIIENARLYQQVQERAEQADSLRRVAELASSMITSEQDFKVVLAEIARITNSEVVYIHILDFATNNLVTYPRWVYGIQLNEPLIQDMSDPRYRYIPANSGKPYYTNNAYEDPNLLPNYKALSRRFNLEKSLVVPLAVGDRSLGELGVSNRKDRPYNDDDVISMITIAAQVASAIDRLLVYEATGENLRRRVEELDAISRVSNELTLTTELDRVLEVIRRESAVGTYADHATLIVLRNPDQWRNESEPELDYRKGNIPGISRLTAIEKEAVLRGVEPIIVNDYTHSDIAREPEDALSAVAASFLYLDQVVGVIHVYHPEANYFDERASGFLSTLATKASLAYQGDMARREQLDRGVRLRQRVEQLSRIFELGQMIQSNTSVPTILEAIAYSVSQSVGFDTALVTVLDENAGVLRRVAHAGIPLDAFESTRDRVISYERLQTLLKDDYRMSESYFFPIERVEDWYQPEMRALSIVFEDKRSIDSVSKEDWRDGDMLIVKISGQGGNLLGLLTLDRPYDNKRPTRSTIEVLEIFTHQASTMIENTRLFMESRRNAEQEAQLATMMESISRTMDKSSIVDNIATYLHQMLAFDRLTVVLANTDDYNFDYFKVTFKDDATFDLTSEQRHSLEQTALGQVYENREEYFYRADQADDEPRHQDVRSWVAAGEQAIFIVPMMAGGDCLGVIHVGTQSPQILDIDSRQLIVRTAQLVAGSIQNARLFDQAVNLQVLTQSVVESIQQGIVVLDNSGHIISANHFMYERYGWNDEAIGQDLFTYLADLHEFLYEDLQTVLNTGEPQEHLNLTSMDRRGELLVRNFYLYPLRSGDQIRGAVLLVEDVSERTRLEQTIESRANQLAALTDVSIRITASLEREEVIGVAMREMGWIIPFNAMSIWRRNGSYMVCEGLTGVPNAMEYIGMRLLITDEERFVDIVENQRVVSGSIAPDQSSLPGDIDAASWMGIPMMTQGHVTGLMLLLNAETKFYEQRADQHVAFAFASQVTTALANADLFEQTFTRTNELGTVLEAAQATSSSRDVGEIFRVVSELMFSSLDIDEVMIMMWDDVDDQLEVRFAVNRFGQQGNLPSVGHRYDVSKYPARQRSIQNRETIVIVDLPDADIPYAHELEELRSVGHMARMLVPLIVSEKTTGMMLLQQQTANADTITQQKVRLAMALGAQVAIALENSRLSQETTQRFEELLTINELSQAISSTLRLEDMLPIIKQQVPQVTRAEEMYLALYNETANTITFPLAVRNGEEFNIAPRELGSDEISYIIKRRHSLSLGADYFNIDDLRKSMGITNGEGDVKAYMGVPLVSGDQLLGVLAIRNTTIPRTFNLNDDRILSTVGSQLAAAIQNARLFEQITAFADELNALVEERTDELETERDRLDTLYQITSELARTLDMENLLERALSMVGKAVGADDGVIMLIDPATDQLHSTAWYNADFVSYEDDGVTAHHPAEGLAEWLIQNDDTYEHIIIVKDLHDTEYWDSDQIGGSMRSALAVILENNEDPMGVMVLLSETPGAFTENHLKLLVPAANQVAASINSADLYQLIRSQAERMGRLLRSTQEDSQKYSAILESITDGVMLADSNGEIILFNSAAERILKVSRQEVMGQPVTKLAGIYGATINKWSQMLEEWTESLTNQSVGNEFLSERIELDDMVVSTYLSPVYIGDAFLGTVSVFRDITSDVEADRVKSEFIENVSHEFRTPLTPIKGYADLLIMGAGGQLSEMQDSMVKVIKENVDRLSVLVNDVLNIAKLDNPDMLTFMQQVSLVEIIPDVLEQVASRPQNLAKNLAYSVDVPRSIPLIRADRDKLIQVFNNIIDNAFNYTPSGGTITVSAHIETDNRHVLVAVADTGLGIPEEFREAAWRRFERYDQHALQLEVAGTGLGLPLVRELVKKHNGDVWFESELNKGTTFYIRLPIEQPNYMPDNVGAVDMDTESLAGD